MPIHQLVNGHLSHLWSRSFRRCLDLLERGCYVEGHLTLVNHRDYKQCAAGEYYHIYNRGNAKDALFRDDEDYAFFLHRLAQVLGVSTTTNRWFRPLPANAFSCIAYCLMPNHFHFLFRQNSETPTSALIGRVCTSYAKYFNKKYDRVGHLFQDQFKQKNVQENNYLLWLSAYVHQNPVKAGLVPRAGNWRWSSMQEYMGAARGGLVAPNVILEQLEGMQYADWLEVNGGRANQYLHDLM